MCVSVLSDDPLVLFSGILEGVGGVQVPNHNARLSHAHFRVIDIVRSVGHKESLCFFFDGVLDCSPAKTQGFVGAAIRIQRRCSFLSSSHRTMHKQEMNYVCHKHYVKKKN